MKKSLIIAIAGVAGAVASSYGQGFVALDNYSSALHPLITFGVGSGGILGNGVDVSGYTVGLYFAQGNITGSVAADPSGTADPNSQNALLQLGTGNGSSVALFDSTSTAGEFLPTDLFQAATLAQAPSGAVTVTIEVIAFNGATYNSSTVRGHSAAFFMNTAAGSSPTPNYIGDVMPTFDVRGVIVPEPSTFALIGLGTGALLFFRRRK